MLGHLNTQLAQLRRDQIQLALKPEYKPICAIEVPENSQYLFGDDIAKQLKDVKETSRPHAPISELTKFAAWTEITNDKEILSDVSGLSIECTETPVQHWLPSQKFDDHESFNRIKQEINKLVDKRVIEAVEYNPQHILSCIFVTPKRDGSYRLTLNLKKFSRLVVNHHFKMHSLYTITKLLVPNCFMASIDLKMHAIQSP